MAANSTRATQFDDSEDEDDYFNPAPADLSDDENTANDDADGSDSQTRKEPARRQVAEYDYDDGNDDEEHPVKRNGKNKTRDGQEDDAADDNREDDDGEG